VVLVVMETENLQILEVLAVEAVEVLAQHRRQKMAVLERLIKGLKVVMVQPLEMERAGVVVLLRLE
jgi:hypothetical protein